MKEKEALVLIDIQNDYFPQGRYPLKGMKKAVRVAAALLDAWRKDNRPVVHVRHINIQPGATFFLPGTAGAEIHSLVVPLPGETVFEKNYPNSFRQTGLDEWLKKEGITTVHIAGAMTNMCIDTTVRAGFDLGYSMVLHQDACAAVGFLGTRLVHKISVKTLGSVFARVV
ncbi:MAG: cysteine hydrolase [Spirochaetales bacterium]|nr:cysteine hydrolase [Spirochaetales bacterium]